MPLDWSVMSATARIVGQKPDPDNEGQTVPVVLGTGFLCSVPSRTIPGRRLGYAITADHVVWDQNEVEIRTPEGLNFGAQLRPPEKVNGWRSPLDHVDLSIASLFPWDGWKRRPLASALKIEEHFLPPNLTPPLGNVVHYVGVLEQLDRVMVRSGTIGAINQEGIAPRGYEYPLHLMDCRSYAGFSGSPCYAEFEAPILEPTFPWWDDPRVPGPPRGDMEYRALLCGMLTWHLTDDRSPVASEYGVVAMLPSSEIWRALMSKELQDERDNADEEHLAAKRDAPGPKPTNLSTVRPTQENGSEWDRFEALTRKMVTTPKPDKNG